MLDIVRDQLFKEVDVSPAAFRVLVIRPVRHGMLERAPGQCGLLVFRVRGSQVVPNLRAGRRQFRQLLTVLHLLVILLQFVSATRERCQDIAPLREFSTLGILRGAAPGRRGPRASRQPPMQPLLPYMDRRANASGSGAGEARVTWRPWQAARATSSFSFWASTCSTSLRSKELRPETEYDSGHSTNPVPGGNRRWFRSPCDRTCGNRAQSGVPVEERHAPLDERWRAAVVSDRSGTRSEPPDYWRADFGDSDWQKVVGRIG